MTPADTTRLTHLLAMTSSNHDGEALNAIRLAYKFMREHDINWQDVVEGKGMPNGAGDRQTAYQEGYEAGYAKGLADGKRAPRTRPHSWRALTEEILGDHDDQISDWERTFLTGFLYRRWHTPTERQHAVFERIADRLDLEIPTACGAD